MISYQHPKLANPAYSFLGPNSQGIITRLSDGTLAYSEDGGEHWHEENDFSIIGLPVISADGKNLVAMSSVDNSVHTASFEATSPYEGHLGAFSRVPLHFIPDYFVVHPTDPRGLVAIGRHDACNVAPTGEECRNVFYLSTDFGRTWRLLIDYAGDYLGWSYTVTNPNSLYEVVYEDYAQKSGSVWNLPLGSKRMMKLDLTPFFTDGVVQSPTPRSLISGITSSVMSRGLIFVTKPRDPQRPSLYDIALYTSHDFGATFKHVRLPTSSSQAERYYAIMDIHEGSVFVNVLFQATNWGNLYSSDSNGDNYAMNLRYNSRPMNQGVADFARVHGIDGIYLANVELTPQTAGAQVASRITFDRGGEWFPLAAPTGACPANGSDCHLHLRAQTTSTRTNFYSRSMAIGTVFGTGTVGAYLGSSRDFNTYMSNDAGKRWQKIFDGSYTYDISQNGGIFVALKEGAPTNSLKWSHTNGLHWSECLLPAFGTKRSTDAEVLQMDAAQWALATKDWTRAPKREFTSLELAFDDAAEASSRHFIPELPFDNENQEQSDSLGTRSPTDVTIRAIKSIPSRDASARFLVSVRTQNEQAIVYLDFNHTSHRACTGWDRPGPLSDYEPWTPSDIDGDGCVLGKKLVYARKKAIADCWIVHNQPPQVLMSIECPCTRQDYMCDYCFAPNVTNPSICELDCADYDPNQVPQPCIGNYRQTTGYRLVAGDSCKGGVDKLGPIVACPPSAPEPVPVPVPTPVPAQPPVQAPAHAPTPVHTPAPVPVSPPHTTPTHVPPPTAHPTSPPAHPAPSPVHSPPTHTPTHPPTEAPHVVAEPEDNSAPTKGTKPPSKIVLVAIIAGMSLVLLLGIIATLVYLSSRNARVRHSLLRCLPDGWLPAYMPPDREEGPQYHRLQGTSLNSGNDDIFNDDEFLQEDANVLDLDDE
jgi:hypothetical protein